MIGVCCGRFGGASKVPASANRLPLGASRVPIALALAPMRSAGREGGASKVPVQLLPAQEGRMDEDDALPQDELSIADEILAREKRQFRKLG